MSAIDVIDRNALARVLDSVGGDTDFLAELLAAFYEDSPQQIVAMRTALASGDAETLRRAAHSLKSNSANFGALILSQQCKELEALAKIGALDGAEALIAAIDEGYQAARSALEAIKQSTDPRLPSA